MLRVFKWVFCTLSFLILVAIVGVVIFISQFDLNEYKPAIEKLVYEQTGRKLLLNGDIGVKLSMVPTISVKDVALSNASWAGDKPMVKIKEADVTLGLLPLINKKLEIENVNVISPEINLSVNKEGVGNWVFEKPNQEQQEGEQKVVDEVEQELEEEVNAAAAPLLAGVVAKKLYISDGSLNYKDLKSGSTTNLKMNTIELASENMDSSIDLKYDVVFNSEAITGSAKADSINTILKNEPYHVMLGTKAYNVQLKANATLTDLMGDLGFDVDVDAYSPNGNFNLPKTQVNAKVSGTPQVIKAVVNKLDIGGNVVKGNVQADLSGKKPSINADLSSAQINVALFKSTQKSAYLNIIKTADAASFVPNEKLDVSFLKDFNAQVKFDVKNLILNEDISLKDVKGTAKVQQGVLTLSPFSAVAGDGTINGDLSLNSEGNVLSLKLDGKDVIIQKFLTNLNPQNDSTFGFKSGGETTLFADLKSSGQTYPKLVENLNGQLIVVINKSQLQAGALKYLKGNFLTQLLSALKLQAKDPKMSLKCAVLRTDLKDGKADFPKGIVFDSKKMMVVGDGKINLKNDKIDIAIKPFNGNLTDTNIAQAISSLVKVSGTVSNPGIAIDTASVVKNVVGVAVTGPAYIGSQLLLDADSAPCYTALKGTKFSDMFEAPKGVKAGAQSVYQGTSDLVEGGINLVTGTAGGAAKGGADLIGGAAKGMFNLLTGKSQEKAKKEE